jgi:cytoskeletal protein RodZ
MALSMDEERMLAEIERRLADDDPVLASRLTTFRLPRVSLGARSPRARMTASMLLLVVVAAVSVFVYALMPFRGQHPGSPRTGESAHPTLSASASSTGSATSPVIRPASSAAARSPSASSAVTHLPPSPAAKPAPSSQGKK